MPLENAIPRIDDRNYDSLIAEVRTRIARYTPEWTPVWTDVNDNDPGMTLAQVFAWMAEMLPQPPLTRNQVELMEIDSIAAADSPGPAVAGPVFAQAHPVEPDPAALVKPPEAPDAPRSYATLGDPRPTGDAPDAPADEDHGGDGT